MSETPRYPLWISRQKRKKSLIPFGTRTLIPFGTNLITPRIKIGIPNQINIPIAVVGSRVVIPSITDRGVTV